MKSRFILLSGCCLLLLAAVTLVQAEEAKNTKEASALEVKPEVKKAATQTPVALTLEAIREFDERKTALDTRERQIDERTKELELQEKLLKEKLFKIEELNKRMAEKLDTFKKEHDQKLTKLVTVVESMKPQSAAEYVENLDPELAVEILGRIQVLKAAKILNLVDKKKSARLTELYTGYRDSIEDVGADKGPPVAKEAVPTNKKM